MRWEWWQRHVVLAALALVAVLFAIGWATREDPSDQPYLEVLGGGFMFNFRNAEAFYGFTAEVVRPLASGSIIEASFEDPAGGAPHVVSERVSPMTDRYALRSPPLSGIEAKKPYRVSIRVYDRKRETLLWQAERTYASQLSGEVVPERPLTVGPGYHRNPELAGGEP